MSARNNLVSDKRTYIHNSEFSHIHHTDSAQEERDLPYWTMIPAIYVVEDVSECLDIPILEFFNNLGASSILTLV